MRLKSLFAFSLALVAAPSLALAAPGDLDATFGGGTGYVVTPIAPGPDSAWDVVLQPDGKIVAVGQSRTTTTDFALVRHNADGSLDGTFGTGGIVVTPVGAGDEIARGVLVQPDGKLVAVGYSNNGSNNDFALVRYNPDGSLDGTFGTGGIVTTPIGTGGDNALHVARQDDGKLVVAGYAAMPGTGIDPVVARYDADGTLDGTFGTGGIVAVPVGAGTDTLAKLAIQPDGKIVTVGYVSAGGVFDFLVMRLESDGSLDGTFDGDGIVTTAIDTNYAIATSLVLDPDGRITVVGYTRNVDLDTDVAVVRYNADGSLDTSFDGDGKVQIPVGPDGDNGRAIAREADGKLVIVGNFDPDPTPTTSNDIFVLKLDADGSLDASFGTGGIKTLDLGGYDVTMGLALQDDGKIVAAGNTGPISAPDFVVLRFDNVVCGDSAIGDGETCDEGAQNGAEGSCCSATCTLVTAGTECRAAADACEAAATCDGASPVCPANTELPDGDGDGACDAIDACTTLDPGQVFSTKPKSRVVLAKINAETVPGNDTFALGTQFALPPGRSFADLDPLDEGVRVLLLADDGTSRLDVTVPAGAYSTATKAGWKLSGNGKAWRFVDKSASPAGGIAQVVLNDRNTVRTPRVVKVTVKGRKSTYPVVTADSPVQAIVTLGDATAAEQGLCGESAYAASHCKFNVPQNRLTCRR